MIQRHSRTYVCTVLCKTTHTHAHTLFSLFVSILEMRRRWFFVEVESICCYFDVFTNIQNIATFLPQRSFHSFFRSTFLFLLIPLQQIIVSIYFWYSQGLTYARGELFESTGLYGQSTVRILDKDSANVKKKVGMEPRLFGEGMTFYKDKLVQITWKSQEGFIYNMDDLQTIDRFRYTTTLNEGWGITWDRCNDELIVTDGSPNLHFWDPETMAEKRKISVVRLSGTPAKRLNEIEFWRGRVLANVWFEDVLLVINPTTGLVEKEYDFKSLWPEKERKAEGADVFNGISISNIPDQLYVTGKLWNRMFVIELLP